MLKHLRTINEVKGYTYSNGSSGKKWRIGRKQISVGKRYTGAPYGEYESVLVVTDLDTGEIIEATEKMYKKFLTP